MSLKKNPRTPTVNPLETAFTRLAKAFVKKGGTKVLSQYFPYIGFAYFGNKLGYSYRNTLEPNYFNKLVGCLANLGEAFSNIFPSIHPFDLLWGIITGIGMYIIVYFKKKNAKKFRNGIEYGSARWGKIKDIEPFMDQNDPDKKVVAVILDVRQTSPTVFSFACSCTCSSYPVAPATFFFSAAPRWLFAGNVRT